MKITASVAGATGLVGGHILRLLLEDPEVGRVVAPTRRPLPPHTKLENPLLKSGFPPMAGLDEAYDCLGTTRKDAGSDAAFRAVDFELAVAFARATKEGGAARFGLVSSLGADAKSRLLYPRVKGEAENAIAGFGFASLVIARPALLLGKREKTRATEVLAEPALALLKPLLIGPLRKYRAIKAETVAAALIAAVRGGVPGRLTLESDALQG